MHWIYPAEFVFILILICWRFSPPNLLPQTIALCKIIFQLLEIAFRAIEKHLLPLIHLYNESLQKDLPRDRTTQTPDCDSCARLRHQLTELQEKQQTDDFNTCIQSVMHEQKVELEFNLNEANAELERREHFLRVAEEQANHQRAEIHSLREELRLARDDNDEDFKKRIAIQKTIDRLRQQNAQLTTTNLQQTEHTLRQKDRALRAERELEIWADKIKTLVNHRNELRCELDRVRAAFRHQERRASVQREGRIRVEVENEELRRSTTTVWREQGAMFT